MLLVVFVVGVLVAGAAGSAVAWQRAAPWEDGDTVAPALDRVSGAMILALAIATAGSWVLALARILAVPGLLGLGVVALVAGGVVLVRRRSLSIEFDDIPRSVTLAIALGLAPLIFWLAFVAWRGAILPVHSHDALAYHFPKAVMMMKAHGFHVFDVPEPRIASWPASYELLLSDFLLLQESDEATAALGTFSYVLFLVFTARTAASFWGDGLHLVVVTMLTAATPIALLHSGLHKNDLLFGSYCLGAIGWSARWVTARCRTSFFFAAVAVLLAVGTKVSGAFVVAAIAPALVWGIVKARPTLGRSFWIGVALLVPSGLLLGGVVYIANLVVMHRVTLPPELAESGYGDFGNIWRFTYMALAKPFSSSEGSVYVPWRGENWWWPSNDIWCSHLGYVVSIATLLLAPLAWFYRKQGRPRRVEAVLALALYALHLPVHVIPLGFFSGFVRYIVFVAPVVLALTVSPVVLDLQRRTSPIIVRWAALGLSGVYFVLMANEFGIENAYSPFRYVRALVAQPESRVPWVRQNRAATIFDQLAPPNAVCAVDVGFDSWVYPAWGKEFTRDVRFIPRSEGPVVIDDSVQWVLVDRSWNVFFGHPRFVDMGKAAYLGRGMPSDADTKVYRQMLDDPRFVLAFRDDRDNQAVFARREVRQQRLKR